MLPLFRDLHGSDHSGFKMAGNQAAKLNVAGARELPNDFSCPSRCHMHDMGRVVRHTRRHTHFPRMLGELFFTGEHHFVHDFTFIMYDETDRFAAFDVHKRRCETHAVAHVDVHPPVNVVGTAWLSKAHGMHCFVCHGTFFAAVSVAVAERNRGVKECYP